MILKKILLSSQENIDSCVIISVEEQVIELMIMIANMKIITATTVTAIINIMKAAKLFIKIFKNHLKLVTESCFLQLIYQFRMLIRIVGFCLRFNVSLMAWQKLINMVRVLASPDFLNEESATIKVSKMYEPPKDVIKICYYCPLPQLEIKHYEFKRK